MQKKKKKNWQNEEGLKKSLIVLLSNWTEPSIKETSKASKQKNALQSLSFVKNVVYFYLVAFFLTASFSFYMTFVKPLSLLGVSVLIKTKKIIIIMEPQVCP